MEREQGWGGTERDEDGRELRTGRGWKGVGGYGRDRAGNG